jgi:hypothetical protein
LKERYAVSNDNAVNLIQPGILIDQLTDVLRNGARILLIRCKALSLHCAVSFISPVSLDDALRKRRWKNFSIRFIPKRETTRFAASSF